MSRRPAISIITPTYNRRHCLARAIRSVQQQSLADYEHLIVDDCSQDGTESFVRSLDDPRIRYLRFDCWRGGNAARNSGIELARAEWLTFLDSDDEFLPHRLATTAAACDGPSAPALLISSFQTMKRGRVRPAVNPTVLLSGPELERALMTYGIFVAGSCITVRRDVLLRAGCFASHIQRMQDREALLRLSQHSCAQLLSEVDWIKHPSPDSISGRRDGYVEALGALLAAHPDLADRYRVLVGYHLARHVLADLLGGRWGQALASLRANRRGRLLRFSLVELVRDYLAGSSQRRALVALLHHRAGEMSAFLPPRPRQTDRPLEPAAVPRAA